MPKIRGCYDRLAYSVGFYGPHRGTHLQNSRQLAQERLTCVAELAAKGVFLRLAEVKVQEGESIESALRRFKRKVQQEDIIKDIKKHSFYLKPGDRRRAKQALLS